MSVSFPVAELIKLCRKLATASGNGVNSAAHQVKALQREAGELEKALQAWRGALDDPVSNMIEETLEDCESFILGLKPIPRIYNVVSFVVKGQTWLDQLVLELGQHKSTLAL